MVCYVWKCNHDYWFSHPGVLPEWWVCAYLLSLPQYVDLFPGAMYIVSRLIVGFGLPYAIVAGSSLIGELAYPRERAILTSLFNAAYFIGAIVASAVTYGTQLIPSDWYVLGLYSNGNIN